MTNPPPSPPGTPQPSIEIPADLVIEYANLVRISHSLSDLVFEFAHMLPGTGAARLTSRIVMSPIGAKLLLRALSENLSKYEAAFGEINIPGNSNLADALFRSAPPPGTNEPK